jgi:lysyl hydroxylase/galactosyltransferase/glucosyltransferase
MHMLGLGNCVSPTTTTHYFIRYGKWSSARYRDTRLKGGYEPVPTQDIHFNQFGFASTWNAALRTFVAPLAETIWPGYNFKGKETLDFIVR